MTTITINDFQSNLTPEEFVEIQTLSVKNILTITKEESERFAELKKKVEDKIALSKKTESLQSLKNKEVFSLIEILTFLKDEVDYEYKDFTTALKAVFPPAKLVPSPVLAVYKIKVNGKEVEHQFRINDGVRLSGEIGEAIKKGGLVKFKENITAEGILWLNENATKIEIGKAIGQWKRENLNELKKRMIDWFKDVKKRDEFYAFLDKELEKE